MWHLDAGCGGEDEIGVPQNDGFRMGNPSLMDDDWGYPYFRTPPYRRYGIYIYISLDVGNLLG